MIPYTNYKEPSESDRLIEDLKTRLEKLEETLKTHQHLGKDGSAEFSGETRFIGKEFMATSVGTLKEKYLPLQFKMIDAEKDDVKDHRKGGTAIVVFGGKETADEQIQMITAGGKQIHQDEAVPTNKADFDKLNSIQLATAYMPQHKGAVSGVSSFPPFGFLFSHRTPTIFGVGNVSGNTLVDMIANFTPDQLKGSIAVLIATGETRKIKSNTHNTITLEENFETTGNQDYQVVTPVFLGSANIPFTRLYVSEDIRLGYGGSNGNQVRYIKFGKGSPEGVITANIGSLYLREDGSTDTTLYIKTANNGQATGWTNK
jgi:hypothetical protein